MGLDMYLTKEYYVKNWPHQKPEQRLEVRVTKGGIPVDEIDPAKVSGVIVEIAYWRKANQIHNWFVQNVQKGVDECQTSYVGVEELLQLLLLCKEALDNRERAATLLPPTDGFFFGSTDVDEYYFKDLEYTVRVLGEELSQYIDFEKAKQMVDAGLNLEDVLKPSDDKLISGYHYHSSW